MLGEILLSFLKNDLALVGSVGAGCIMIAGKLETLQEMQTALAAKRLEQSVMNIMPFAIVMYLDFSNPGYFDMLFHNVSGVLIMTGCMGVYLFAYAWAEHIFMKLYR